MRALATQELNPMIIPPDILKNILNKIMENIKSNARLRLSEDPKTNIWAYYGNVRVQNKVVLVVVIINPNDPMLLLLDNSDSPSIVEQ